MTALAFTRPPHDLLVEPIVRRALEEDLGRAGDVTTDLTIEAGTRATARMIARQSGTLSGMIVAAIAFRLVDPSLIFRPSVSDGEAVGKGTLLATIEGSARALLTGERTALNFTGLLSGTASATRKLVDAVSGTNARITCTRKTIPGLRVLQKYAVRCGGGFNHRMGLDDAILIKDNHLAAAGGIKPAVARVRAGLGHTVKIELEVDTLAQLEEAFSLGVDLILLDNMSIDDMKRAVALSRGKAVLEASGGITLDSVRAIAETGVDYISSGALTHSAPNLDVALDF